MKEDIESLGNPDFRAERSFLKEEEIRHSRQDDIWYGTRGSVRIDVFEKVRDDLVCVYDLKTGTRGLSIPRMIEISTRVLRHFPPQARVIVTEVRVPR
jgi:hypothetical protein